MHHQSLNLRRKASLFGPPAPRRRARSSKGKKKKSSGSNKKSSGSKKKSSGSKKKPKRKVTSRQARAAFAGLSDSTRAAAAAADYHKKRDVGADCDPTKDVSCTGISQIIHYLQALGGNAETAARCLVSAGWTPERVAATYNDGGGMMALTKAIRTECHGLSRNFTPAILKQLSNDITTVRAREAVTSKKLLETLKTDPSNIKAVTQIASNAARKQIELESGAMLQEVGLARADNELQRLKAQHARQHAQLKQNAGEARRLAAQQQVDAQATVEAATADASVQLRETMQSINTLSQLKTAYEKGLKSRAELLELSRDNLEADLNDLKCLFDRAYEAEPGDNLAKMTEAVDVQPLVYDDEGIPSHKSLSAKDMGPVFRQAYAVKQLIANHYQNGKQCAAVLSKYGIDNKAGWDALLDYLSTDPPEAQKEEVLKARRNIMNQVGPCLFDALYAVKTGMTDQLAAHLDENGFITDQNEKNASLSRVEAAKKLFVNSDGKAVDGKDFEDVVEKFTNTNRYIPQFEAISGTAKTRWDEWIKHIFAKNPAEDLSGLDLKESDFKLFSTMGTGYLAGPTPLVPKPLGDLFKDVHSQMLGESDAKVEGLDDGDKGRGKAVVGMMKSVYNSMISSAEATATQALSPAARDLVAVRQEVINSICRALEQQTVCSSAEMRLLDAGPGVEESDKTPFQKAESRLAQMSQGLIEGVEVASFGKADAGIESLKGALQTVYNTKKISPPPTSGANQVLFSLIRAMDLVFGISVDCDDIATLPEVKRKSAFLSYFRNLVPKQTDLIRKAKCGVTARAVDNVMYKQFSKEMSSLRPFVKLPLVDVVMLSMGIPSESELIHGGGKFCPRRHALLRSGGAPVPRLVKCFETLRTQLAATCNLNVDAQKQTTPDAKKTADANWRLLVCRAIQASRQFRFLEHAFLASTEYEGAELWGALKSEARYFVSADVFAKSSKANEYGENKFTVGAIVGDTPKDDKVVEIMTTLAAQVRNWAEAQASSEPELPEVELNTTTVTEQGGIPLVIAASALNALSMQLGKVLPETYDMSTALRVSSDTAKTTESDKPMILQALRAASLEMMSCAASTSTNALFPMPTEIKNKQLRIISKQARTLCLLPKSQCLGQPACVWLDAKANGNAKVQHCMVSDGKQVWKNDKVEWRDDGDGILSKTAPKTLGYNASHALSSNIDVWRVGFDTMKEQLLGGANTAKGKEWIYKHYEKIRVTNYINQFIAIVAPNHGLAGGGESLLESLAASIEGKIKFMDQLRKDEGCTELYDMLVELCNLFEALAFEDKTMEPGALTAVFTTLSDLKGAAVPGDKQNPGTQLDFSAEEQLELFCRIAQALLNHYAAIKSIKCDLINRDHCLSRGSECSWEYGKCYNPLIHSLKGPKWGRGIGIVRRVLLPRLKQVLSSPASNAVGNPGHGIKQLLGALYGAKFASSFAFMSASEQDKALRDALAGAYTKPCPTPKDDGDKDGGGKAQAVGGTPPIPRPRTELAARKAAARAASDAGPTTDYWQADAPAAQNL